jgi:hypothetical protein
MHMGHCYKQNAVTRWFLELFVLPGNFVKYKKKVNKKKMTLEYF